MPTKITNGTQFYTNVRSTYKVSEYLKVLKRVDVSQLELTPVITTAKYNNIYGVGKRSTLTKNPKSYWYLDVSIPIVETISKNHRGINTLIHPTIHGFISKWGRGADHNASEYTKSLERKYGEFKKFSNRLKEMFPKIKLIDEYTRQLKARQII